MRTEKILSKDDPELLEHYGNLVNYFPNATFIEDESGVYRFKSNKLIRWLIDNAHECGRKCPVNLNSMAIAYDHGVFTLEEYMKFYQDLGYSLSGFMEIFGDEI